MPTSARDDPGDHRAVDSAEEEREGGQRDELGKPEEGEDRQRLAEPDRAAVARREDEPVDDALLPLGGERARETEERGEDDRDPEQPLRRELGRVARQDEVEHDERGEDEEQHRRQRVAGAQLEEQVLARERADVGQVHHASASFDVASRSMRAGSCVATTNAQLRPALLELAVEQRGALVVERRCRARRGRAGPGSCRSVRQSASRCSIPRE